VGSDVGRGRAARGVSPLPCPTMATTNGQYHHTPQSGSLQVAVTGASGFVGRHVVRALVDGGHHVRALTRDRNKARKLFASLPAGRVSIVQGDITDAKALAELTTGANAAIHLVGILREGPNKQTFQRCHVEATRAILTACIAAKVNRYLHMSALGVKSDGISDYQRTKWEGERLVRATELEWTIFRPGLIHGPDGEFTQLAAGWARGSLTGNIMPYFTRWQTDKTVPLGPSVEIAPTVAPVSVLDVAAAFVSSLSREQSVGEIYNLTGPERLTWPEMLEFIKEHVPHAMDKAAPWGMPGWLGATVAFGAKQVGLGGLLPFDVGMAKMGAEDSVSERVKVRTQLGLEPKPFREVFEGYAARV